MSQSSASGHPAAGQASVAGYAGDVDVADAWEALQKDPDAVLVDVRTKAEWTFVGVPDLSGAGKETVLVEWQEFPTMAVNPSFVETVKANVSDVSSPVYFLCRSGARSKSAAIALTEAGYQTCYNISEGFEGPHDAERHRGKADGWKARGLPWLQG